MTPVAPLQGEAALYPALSRRGALSFRAADHEHVAARILKQFGRAAADGGMREAAATVSAEDEPVESPSKGMPSATSAALNGFAAGCAPAAMSFTDTWL